MLMSFAVYYVDHTQSSFYFYLLVCMNVQDGWMDGWMTCNFTSFTVLLQSYQDDERLIMKGCVQWYPVYG